MGQLISAARAEINKADRELEEKAKQDLEILQKLVDAKLDEFQRFLNPDATAKTQVPGIRALRWERRAYSSISSQPADEIDKAIDSFFTIGDGNDKQAIKDGFKGVVKSALNIFLGNTETGEKNEEKFFVYMTHNTIVRIDVKLWRWNFAGKGFSDTYKSCLGYIMCLSVVDPTKLRTAEFVYLISEYAGDDEENVNRYIEVMQKMYNTARKMKLDARDATGLLE
ncbi:hypothetical protein ACJ41O_010267 [Fusarium nematophilum]